MCVYIYVYTEHIYIYIYIYIERERDVLFMLTLLRIVDLGRHDSDHINEQDKAVLRPAGCLITTVNLVSPCVRASHVGGFVGIIIIIINSSSSSSRSSSSSSSSSSRCDLHVNTRVLCLIR